VISALTEEFTNGSRPTIRLLDLIPMSVSNTCIRLATAYILVLNCDWEVEEDEQGGVLNYNTTTGYSYYRVYMFVGVYHIFVPQSGATVVAWGMMMMMHIVMRLLLLLLYYYCFNCVALWCTDLFRCK